MVVGRQICTKGLIEISTETGNTVFPEDSIGTDELAHVLRRYIAEEFLRHSAGSNHPGSECKHAGRTVRAGKKIQAGVLGTERTYSSPPLFSRIKLMAARYCETLMVPCSVKLYANRKLKSDG